MMNERSGIGERKRLRKGDRVQPVPLKMCIDDGQFALRPSRGPRVFVAMHEFGCDECTDYVQQIVSLQEDLASWCGDIVVVGPECLGASAAELAELGVPVLEDPDHLLSSGRLTVIIADEWGEIYFAGESDSQHDAISPDEVLDWVKFVAIQCPECESPEGEWRDL